MSSTELGGKSRRPRLAEEAEGFSWDTFNFATFVRYSRGSISLGNCFQNLELSKNKQASSPEK